jgi:tetratricopeptide (TPR) repeat protein
MKTLVSSVFSYLYLAVFLSGCASYQVGNDFQAGREAFLIGNNESALSYFQIVAQKEPNYTYGVAMREGILSYLGRAKYASGKLPQARQTLEKAIAMNQNDELARLYVGLTLARSGERQRALKEIEGGLQGLYDQIEYITKAGRGSYGDFWDTRREIRNAIQSDLATISGKEVDLPKLIADCEWLGKRVEEEIDLARRDESRERQRDSSGRDNSR